MQNSLARTLDNVQSRTRDAEALLACLRSVWDWRAPISRKNALQALVLRRSARALIGGVK